MRETQSPYSLAFIVGDTRFELVTPCLSIKNNYIILIDELQKSSVYGSPRKALSPYFPYCLESMGQIWDILELSLSNLYYERYENYGLSKSYCSEEKN